MLFINLKYFKKIFFFINHACFKKILYIKNTVLHKIKYPVILFTNKEITL